VGNRMSFEGDARCKVQGARCKVQGARCEVRGVSDQKEDPAESDEG
jgi:hypothetical protein